MTPESKQRAIDVHSEQAPAFAAAYRRAAGDAYASCFAYSRKRLEAWLDRTLPPRGDGARAIDVGCGTGHHLGLLRGRGFEVSGIDASAPMLARARKEHPDLDLRSADVEALPYPDAHFDLALSVEVLRYLARPEAALREIARVLRPGGLGLVTAAPLLNLNGYFLVNRLAAALPLPGLTRLKQYFVMPRGLARSLAQAGFTNVEVHGVYLGPINWIERLLPRALPRSLRAWEPIDTRLADQPLLRGLSNMLLAVGRRA